jgi:hypothetical protein
MGCKMNGDNGSGLGASFLFAVGFLMALIGIVNWLELPSSSWLWQIWWLMWTGVGAFIIRAALDRPKV